MMGTRFRALAAPVDASTGDRRRFREGAITTQALPMPGRWQREDAGGHDYAVSVSSLDTVDIQGADVWVEGEWFDDIDPVEMPRLAEDVKEAMYLAEKGVLGFSVDLDDFDGIFVRVGTDDEITEADYDDPDLQVEMLVTQGRMRAATLVAIPAFVETNHTITNLTDDNEVVDVIEEEEDSEEDLPIVASVSGDTDLPIADEREHEWDGGAAAGRVFDHFTDEDGNLDVAQASKAFLWVDKDDNDSKASINNVTMSSCPNSAHAVAAATSQDSSSNVADSGATATSDSAIKEPCPQCAASNVASTSPGAGRTGALTAHTTTTSKAHASVPPGVTQKLLPKTAKSTLATGASTGSNSSKPNSSSSIKAGSAQSAASTSTSEGRTGATRHTSTTATKPATSGAFCADHATGGSGNSETTQSGSNEQPHTFAGLPRSAFKLGFADIVDGELRIIPRGVAATAGGRGVDATDLADSDKDAIKSKICTLYGKLQGKFEDWPECPFGDDSGDEPDNDGMGDAAAQGITAAQRYALVANQGTENVYSPTMFLPPVEITGPTPMTYDTARGIAYGHIYQAGTCHVGFKTECRMPPTDEDFSRFHVHPVQTSEGPRFVGRITAGGDHANEQLSLTQVQRAHDAKTTVAWVEASVDEFGIFVCGPMVPGLDDATLRIMSRRMVSGHWPVVTDEGDIALAEVLALRDSGDARLSEPGFPVMLRYGYRGGAFAGITAAASPAPKVDTPALGADDYARIFRIAYETIREEDAKAAEAKALREELSLIAHHQNEALREELLGIIAEAYTGGDQHV